MVLGIWGVAELILGIFGVGQNIIRELRILSGIWGDQCIILRGQGITDAHLGASLVLVQPRKTRPDITEKLLTGT